MTQVYSTVSKLFKKVQEIHEKTHFLHKWHKGNPQYVLLLNYDTSVIHNV